MKVARCRECGAEILWILTPGGKSIPCDPTQVIYWKRAKAKGKVVTQNGEVISCEFEGDRQFATGTGYISHWSTCPEADQFKRRKPGVHHEV